MCFCPHPPGHSFSRSLSLLFSPLSLALALSLPYPLGPACLCLSVCPSVRLLCRFSPLAAVACPFLLHSRPLQLLLLPSPSWRAESCSSFPFPFPPILRATLIAGLHLPNRIVVLHPILLLSPAPPSPPSCRRRNPPDLARSDWTYIPCLPVVSSPFPTP